MPVTSRPSNPIPPAWLAALLLAACASTQEPAAPARAEVADGHYLSPQELPNSRALLPPPPAPGTPAFANDEAVHAQAMKFKDGPRWTLASRDAETRAPEGFGAFSCALGLRIDASDTPHLLRLLERTTEDAGRSTSAAKRHYQRPRPFMVHDEPTCAPAQETGLRRNGSYPSGHTAFGWSAALVLAEVAPERADALLARGLAFGESRLVCNAHWQSDILAGRTMAAATVARLHAAPAFREDLRLAAREVAAARGRGLAPDRDCEGEAAALAQPIPGVL